jgi:hypothetical protein
VTPLAKLLKQLREDWQVPRVGKLGTFSLACRFSSGMSGERLPDIINIHLPRELREMWSISQECQLFLDDDYGQWGLHILSPFDSENETSLFGLERLGDAEPGDLVIGCFVGDTDVLLIRCDPNAADFGSLIVAPPLDRRADWPIVASSLLEFLQKYAMTKGGKFWEGRKS